MKQTVAAIALLLTLIASSCQRAEAPALQNPQRLSTATTTAPPNPTSEPSAPPTPTHSVSPTPLATPTPTEPPITTLLFTGAIVPGRCVQAAVDERGEADFLYQDVRSIISQADLAIGTLNAALSDYPPRTGCIRTFVLVGGSENADAMSRAGFDIMSVATNHIKNCGLVTCGDRTFLDTLENLQRVGIAPVGAGENLNAALQPVIVTVNGIRFGFISLGEIEPNAFASETTPGIAPLTDENLQEAIARARALSDVVIFMPHWGSDYSATPNYRQYHFRDVALEAGVDLILGNHSHVIQGMQEIEGVPVFYSLGSFVFDQDWSLETQQGIMVEITFEGTNIKGYDVFPVHIDGDGHVYIAPTDEASEILSRFQQISDKIP